jgi:hypothetical protein
MDEDDIIVDFNVINNHLDAVAEKVQEELRLLA